MGTLQNGANNRLDYIDIAKALGMLTIIWGHIAVDKSVTFVYAFHIPLFFFLSGMVFNPTRYQDFGSFLKRKVRTLIVPYIIYSVVTWCIWAGFSYFTHAKVDSYWMPLIQTFIAQGSEGYLVHNVPLWFVPCLFVMEVMYYWISRLSDVWNIITCLFLAATSYVLVNYCAFFDFTTLPLSIDVAMAAIIFYSCGHILVKRFGHEKIELVVNKKRWFSVLIALVSFVIVYYGGLYNGKVSMGHAHLNNPFVFYIIAFLGLSAFIMMSSLVAHSSVSSSRWMNGVKWYGQNSFISMSLHNPIKGFTIVVVAALLKKGKMDVMGYIPTALLVLVMTVVITILFMLVIVKFKNRQRV